ncbi:MAG: hypothetical protein RSB76_02110 [Clostridia bacterium]
MIFKEQFIQYTNQINNELDKYNRCDNCPEIVLNNSMQYSLMARW